MRATVSFFPLLAFAALTLANPALAAATSELTPASPSNDANATIFYNVVKGFAFQDPSWRTTNPLTNWSGVMSCPGWNCTFACLSQRVGAGSVNLTMPKTFTFFKRLNFSPCNPLGGTVDLTHLPNELTFLGLQGQFTGTVDLTQLPPTLRTLDLAYNSFNGTADLGNLPPALEFLDLTYNSGLSGSIPTFAAFPSSLRFLNLSQAGFSGPLDFTSFLANASFIDIRLDANHFAGNANLSKLPSTLRHLDLGYLSLTGSIDWAALPSSLARLFLDGNAFSGSLWSSGASLPRSLLVLELGNNGFAGPVSLSGLPPAMTMLRINNNQLSGAVLLTELVATLTELDLSQNRLSGTLDLVGLPVAMRSLLLKYNSFSGAVNLTALPQGLNTVELEGNQLSGNLNFTRLPTALSILNLRLNRFSGVVDLTDLPSSSGPVTLILANNSLSGTIDLTSLQSGDLESYSLTGNSFFAVWAVLPFYLLNQAIDPSVRIFNTTKPETVMRAGFFTSMQVKRPLLLLSSGFGVLATCVVKIPSAPWRYSNSTGFVADSGILAAGLAPCLPPQFGTYQYLLRPSNTTVVIVTSGTQNVTFTRRG